jgi:hypothetical protein
VKRRLAFCVLATLAMLPVRAIACKVDDASAYVMRDVSGDLLPQRCKEGGDCRIYELFGRQIGAVGDMQLAGTNSEGLIGFRQKETDLQGFLDASGAAVIPARFRQVKPFCEGLAAVQLVSRQWIFIDRVGKQIGGRWEDAESFSDGRAFVNKHQKVIPMAMRSDSRGDSPGANFLTHLARGDSRQGSRPCQQR